MPTIETLRALLEPIPEVQLAVLFGSRARGRPRPISDVDLLVVLAPDGPLARRSVHSTLLAALEVPLDLIWADSASPLLRFEVARHGYLLVSRQPHAWPNFRARAMTDWWDFAPFARQLWAASIRRLREENHRGPA